MRTTIEIPDALGARLLELAARRGEMGFSSLVREAVESYLAAAEHRASVRHRAIEALGSVPEAEAEALAAAVQRLREREP